MGVENHLTYNSSTTKLLVKSLGYDRNEQRQSCNISCDFHELRQH